MPPEVPWAHWELIDADAERAHPEVYRCPTCGTIDVRSGTRTFTIPIYSTQVVVDRGY